MRPAILLPLLLVGCDPPPLPTQPWAPAARALLEDVEQEDFREWTEVAIEGQAPHGAWSIVFTDAKIDAAVDGPKGAESWPSGSTIVCEGRDEADGDAVSLQIMRRDAGGWTWAQYDADGAPLVFGSEAACSHCHGAGDDFVRSLDLP